MPDSPAARLPPRPVKLVKAARLWASGLVPERLRAQDPVPGAPAGPGSPAPKTVLDYIDERTIALDIDETDQEAVIRRLAVLMKSTGTVLDVDAVVAAALEREAISTTGIGEGIAIPHAASAGCLAPTLGFARSRAGVDWNSLDGAPAHLIFMIAVPDALAETEHLKVLALLSRSLMTPSFRDCLTAAATPEDVLEVLAASTRPTPAHPE